MDRHQLLSRLRVGALALSRGVAATLAGLAAFVAVVIVTASILWAGYAATLAFMGAIARVEGADLATSLESRATERAPKGSIERGR